MASSSSSSSSSSSMASSSSSSSSSSPSSSSSSDKEEPPATIGGSDCNRGKLSPTSATEEDEQVGNGDGAIHENTSDSSHDQCKVFLSRIPQTFNEDSVTRILEERFGDGCVVEASIVREKPEADGDGAAVREEGDSAGEKHRGFGFVVFATAARRAAALAVGTARGSARPNSKRRHTLYLRPVVREGEDGPCPAAEGAAAGNRNACFLWKGFRCPYGDACKFTHEGEGGCVPTVAKEGGIAGKKKRQKCFFFKKNGTCRLGADCPYSHDVGSTAQTENRTDAINTEVDKSLKDCINWKNKGKCRKGDKCPYRHDDSVRTKILQKKKRNSKSDAGNQKSGPKVRQSLSIRVFGLNYDTTAEDVRSFFAHCGPIMEVTFPTFEDSGRSKGYCGVLFQSPRAVQKAIELDGSELDGRWLQIQEGKMFLRKWEEGENERRKKGKRGREECGEEKELPGEPGQKTKKEVHKAHR